MDTKFIARVAHEADRTLAAISGDLTVGGWSHAEGWQRESLVRGVKAAIATPGADAEALHEAWRRDKEDAGWTLGATFDLAGKTDPLIRPWPALTALQRRRELLFLAIVRSLATEIQS